MRPGLASCLFARLARHGRFFLLALGFLTRLTPPLEADTDDMRAALPWYPAAGATLGLVLVLPFAAGLFDGQPFVRAWLYVGFSAWLTRALHLDGLADVLDALGSGKSGEDFHRILKDSRLGAFGAAGLALAVSGQIALAAGCFEQGLPAALFFAPLFGRCLPFVLAAFSPANPKAGLGLIFAGAGRGPALYSALGFALAAGFFCLGPARLLLCALLAAAGLLFLARLAKREGGFNGDFLGCAILLGEFAALMAALA